MMWTRGWREALWSELDTSGGWGPPDNHLKQWDVLVIGGGITGAGILSEATRAGLRAILVDANDFAAGTSSRSSKLVHGGFRYLKNGQVMLTYESVRERERLLKEGGGLVKPLAFLMPSYPSDRTPAWLLGVGLTIFDLLAAKWSHRHFPTEDLCGLCPQLNRSGLRGGYHYFDAQTDDSRLVLRVIREAVADGGAALNYAPVVELLRDKTGRVCGVVLEDRSPGGAGQPVEVMASVVINATGAWADELRLKLGGTQRLRKLRGSHLVFPSSRLPLSCAVSLWHPQDGRPVFAVPWDGVVIVGTTDTDHQGDLPVDPSISTTEAEYLMQAAQFLFPCQELDWPDVQATFAGVRPVVDTGKADPSKESREHVLWYENGLLTVTGGKLTTFRLMAHDALKEARPHLPENPRLGRKVRMLNSSPVEAPALPDLSSETWLRLAGRYGSDAPDLVQAARPGELEAIQGAQATWAELRWAGRDEGVIHLDDLLLRRVRLGLLLPEGGINLLERMRPILQWELGWDDQRWRAESKAYTDLWHKRFSPQAGFQSQKITI